MDGSSWVLQDGEEEGGSARCVENWVVGADLGSGMAGKGRPGFDENGRFVVVILSPIVVRGETDEG